MNELLTLAIAPGILWLILVFLRVPGVTLILSILAGKLFSEELSQNLYDAANRLVTIHNIQQVQLFLLFLPVILSIILTQSKTPKSKVVINSIALLFASAALILLALPFTDLTYRLGPSGQNFVSTYQNYIVCAAGAIALLFTWAPGLKPRRKHKS